MNIHLSLHTSNDTSTDRMKNKRNRLSAIRSIIANETIGNQDQMLKRLQEQGFELTQATLSRDLKQLKISKVSTDDGNYKYVLPETPRQRNSNKNLTSHTNLPRQGFLSISFSGNIAVIKTRPGYANAIAYDIDEYEPIPILATIAGDDTILLVIKEGYTRQEVQELLETIIPEMKTLQI